MPGFDAILGSSGATSGLPGSGMMHFPGSVSVPLSPVGSLSQVVRKGKTARGKPQKTAFIIEVEEFNRGLAQLAHDFGIAVANQYKRMMSDVENRAKRRAPVLTGTMRAGIWWRVDLEGDYVVGTIGSHAWYGKYTEFVDQRQGRLQRSAQNNPGRYTGSGTVQNPFTQWPALDRRGGKGQTMPWLRPAFMDVFTKLLHTRLSWALRDALRKRK